VPLTDTTFIWADLFDSQGISQTVVLHDDGQGGDAIADDGRSYANLAGLPRAGNYQRVVATLRAPGSVVLLSPKSCLRSPVSCRSSVVE
jgi:hypothetical protein